MKWNPLEQLRGQVEPRAALITTSLTFAVGMATVAGDWLQTTVPVPFGVLLLFGALILLPTGDLIRLATDYIESARPHDDEFERHK